jgi:hypothetical protein
MAFPLLRRLVLAACVTVPLPAAIIDNSTVTILPSSSPAFAGFEANYALDLGPGRFVSDFASAGQGASTRLDFDFGDRLSFASITYTDRTTSGADNFSFVGGEADMVLSFRFIFSDVSDFSSNNGTLDVVTDGVGGAQISDFQTVVDTQGLSGRYLRWQVLFANGLNAGAADFSFDATAAAVPEPGTMVICGGSLVGLALILRRRQKQ